MDSIVYGEGFGRLMRMVQSVGRKKVGSLSLQSWGFVAALAILVFGFNLGGARSLTYHELYLASGAKQMASEGNWLYMRIGGQPWLEKPPLPHWLVMASASLLGGFNETTCRLPLVLAGIGVVLIVAGMAARFYGEDAGRIAGVVQCTLVYSVTYARLAEEDMLLALLVVAALAVFVQLQSIGKNQSEMRSRWWATSFWILIGLTNLVKGPLFGTVLVLAPCVVWLLWQGRWSVWRRLWSPMGMAVALFLMVIWPVLVMLREPTAINWWIGQTFQRATGGYGYAEPWWYYLTTWSWQLLPWTPLLIAAAVPTLRRAWRGPDSLDRFLWCWALVLLVLLSLSRGKHHHHLIHCLLAMTPIMAVGIQRHGKWIEDRGKVSRYASLLIMIAAVPGIVVAAILVANRFPHLRWDCLVLATGCAVVLGAMSLMAYQGRSSMVRRLMILVVVAGLLYVHGRILPMVDPNRDGRDFLSTVHRLVPEDATLFGTGGPQVLRYSFYVQRPLISLWDPPAVAMQKDVSRPFYVLAKADSQQALEILGEPRQIASSLSSDGECPPKYCIALFRIDPPPGQ